MHWTGLARKARGFTLIELMTVVAIIGILAAIAVPNFLRYQLRARRSEGAVNVAAIRTAQVAYFGAENRFASPAAPNPSSHPFTTKRHPWDSADEDWRALGFEPDSEVYFQYRTEGGTGAERYSFIVSAIADLDQNREFSCWAFARAILADGDTFTSSLELPDECGEGETLDDDGNPVPVTPQFNIVYLVTGDFRY